MIFAHSRKHFRAEREGGAEVGIAGVLAEFIGGRVEDAAERSSGADRCAYRRYVVEPGLLSGQLGIFDGELLPLYLYVVFQSIPDTLLQRPRGGCREAGFFCRIPGCR